jgi:hypothetical protein
MSWLNSIFGKGKQALDTPTIDRKTIVKAYRALIWPVLEADGFTTFKGSAAWRYREKIIDVIDIMFFPISKTRQWGLDPHCFALSGGVFYPFIPYIGPAIPVDKAGKLQPPEIACTDRVTPNRRMKQSHNYPNIWNIAADGSNLKDVFSDVKFVLEQELLPHLNAQGNLLKRLNEMLEAHAKLAKIHPGGYYYQGFIALELGEWRLARDSLRKALETDLYSKSGVAKVANPPEDEIRAAIQKAEAAIAASAQSDYF